MLGGPSRRLLVIMPGVSLEGGGLSGIRSGWNQGAKREHAEDSVDQ